MLRKILNISYYHFRRSNWLIDPKFYISSIYDKIKIQKPIFLLGNQGDGLTLISRVLRRNSSVVSVTGNNQYWAGADEMQQVFGPYLPSKLTGLTHKAPYHPILKPPRSWSYASDELFDLYRNKAGDYTKEMENKFSHVIKYVTYRYGRNFVKPRFIDKSQVFTVKLGLINKLLYNSNPKFVLITRNPYTTCYRAAIGKAKSLKAIDMENYKKILSWEERLTLCAQHWRNSMRSVFDDMQQYKINVLFVSFERFLEHPGEVTKQLCNFIEIDFDYKILPKKKHKMHLGVKFEKKWYPLNIKVNDQYLKKITRHDISIIDNICGETALKLGYCPP